jgi:hypothetical protein
MRRCRVCPTELPPAAKCKTLIGKKRLCSTECAIEWSMEQAAGARAKKERAELKQRKEKAKTRSQWLKEAQAAVNAYVRERDRNLPCVSCGRFHEGQWHAGHYRSVGSAPELRFNTHNIWRQCSACNNHLSGNLINYRLELINRIGHELLAWLEGPHELKKYTIEQLKEIRDDYRAKKRELEKSVVQHDK